METPPVPRYLNAIRTFRQLRGLKQRELGDLIGVPQTEISAYERGEVLPTLPRAFVISAALGRRVEEVFFELFEESLANVDLVNRPTLSVFSTIPPLAQAPAVGPLSTPGK